VQDLTWLLENQYYRANAVHLNEDTLQQLPEDGNLPTFDLFTWVIHQPESPEDQYRAHLSTSFVPNATQQRTEQEKVQQSLQVLQSGSSHTLMWPTIGGAPINKFTTEGYSAWPSPPYSTADFLGHRHNQVIIGNYTYLLKYDGG